MPEPNPVAEGFVRIPANTPVNFEIVDALSSKTSKIDEMFAIRMLDPIVVDGKIVLPAGLVGQGQVVHAAKARGMGKAGELILAARYLKCGETQIALRGFRFGQQGVDRSLESLVASSVFLPVGFFIAGGEMTVPGGAFATARLSKAVDIQMSPTPQCAGAGPMTVPVTGAGQLVVPAPIGSNPVVAPTSTPSTPAIVPASVSKQEGKSE
jgi:hypothetical protein